MQLRQPRRFFSGVIFLLPLLGIAPGCDFFKELDSEDSATDGAETDGAATDTDAGTGTSSSGSGSSTGAAACTLVDDDLCDDQDTLHSCNLETGQVDVYDCGLLCGAYLNFTCINSGTGQHACWCVDSGKQKVYSCGELEACLQGCGNDPTDVCSNQCFSRTTPATIRMFGAVVHCAHAACEPQCKDNPAGCLACLDAAMDGQAAGCAVERSLCDQDQNDEPGP